jgi:hypothetical protein
MLSRSASLLHRSRLRLQGQRRTTGPATASTSHRRAVCNRTQRQGKVELGGGDLKAEARRCGGCQSMPQSARGDGEQRPTSTSCNGRDGGPPSSAVGPSTPPAIRGPRRRSLCMREAGGRDGSWPLLLPPHELPLRLPRAQQQPARCRTEAARAGQKRRGTTFGGGRHRGKGSSMVRGRTRPREVLGRVGPARMPSLRHSPGSRWLWRRLGRTGFHREVPRAPVQMV